MIRYPEILSVLTCLLVANLTRADVIQVPEDYLTVQGGLNGASESDTVQVAAGTYLENIIWPETDGIKLIGAGIDLTILDGGQEASVIHFPGGIVLDSTTLLQGFTITNGLEVGS
jgi:hypothetical protein